MNESDRKAFYETWASAWEVCGKTVTDRMLRFAFEALKGHELPAIQQAVMLHCQDADSGAFPPKPADIVRQIEGGGDERSLKAWTKVEQAIIQVGSWKMLAFDDNRIHAVIADMGGWLRFCEVLNDELPFMRNEFCKRYRAYIQHPPISWPGLITGEGGFKENPVLIGDQGVAQQVMLAGNTQCPVEITELAETKLLQ